MAAAPDGLEERPRSADPRTAALIVLSSAVLVGAVWGGIWLLYRFLSAFSQVFLPLAVGGLAALVFKPWFHAFRTRLRLPAWAALIAVYLSVAAGLTAFGLVFGRLLATQLGELAQRAPNFVENAYAWIVAGTPAIVDFLENHPLGQEIRDFVLSRQTTLLQGLARVGEQAVAASAGILRGMAAVLSWAVLPLYFGFFLLWEPPPSDTARMLPFLKARTRDTVIQLTREFVRILIVFFRAQLVVAFLQGLLVAIGFTAIGLDYGFVIGLALGVLTIIPYLGTAVGFTVAVPLAWIQPDGGIALAALAAGVLVAVQLIEGWILTPRIMGDQTGLHWMAIIVAVLFWGSALGGLTGTLLAIPLTAFAVSAWRLIRERYVVEVV
ncbi:MAG: AI-2E family transporter [Acidobacteria bacterium]|nr:AI-2E family transporter [Acidobacteriota bacterium]